jgi:hypothetical protein
MGKPLTITRTDRTNGDLRAVSAKCRDGAQLGDLRQLVVGGPIVPPKWYRSGGHHRSWVRFVCELQRETKDSTMTSETMTLQDFWRRPQTPAFCVR